MKSSNSRKPMQPARGRCRWLHPPVAPVNDLYPEGLPGRLMIETADHQVGRVYLVSLNLDHGHLVGYRLTQSDGKVYDLDAATLQCDCPDGTFRRDSPGGCKHSRALRVALKRAGFPVPSNPSLVELGRRFRPGRDDEPPTAA